MVTNVLNDRKIETKEMLCPENKSGGHMELIDQDCPSMDSKLTIQLEKEGEPWQKRSLKQR